MTRPAFDIAAAFKNKQDALKASFFAIRNVTTHPTTRGDQGEGDWVGMIRDFLPTRYAVGPIFAVDHLGEISEQIDVAIYDTHFSPQWFGANSGTKFVPVESVYAVFEVKPDFSSQHIMAAQQKVRSVRRLKRTAAPVFHKGGVYDGKGYSTHSIIGGILTTRKCLKDPVEKLIEIQGQHGDSNSDEFLDIGICLDHFSFDYAPSIQGAPSEKNCVDSNFDDPLIYFAVRLFRHLQVIGSVPAIDMVAYEEQALENKQPGYED